MSCWSFPVATAPYIVRAPSSFNDLMSVSGRSDDGSGRSEVEDGSASGDERAQLLLLRLGAGELPLRFGDLGLRVLVLEHRAVVHLAERH